VEGLPEKIDIYERRTIPLEKVHCAVIEQLNSERKMAHAIRSFLLTKEGKRQCENALKPYRDDLQKTFDAMLDEVDKCFTYEEQSAGLLPKLNEQFESLKDVFDHQRRVFSTNNPWLSLFADIGKIAELDKEIVNKLIDKVNVVRFKKIELIPCYFEWKNELPKDWLEAAYGT
jgi:hypothetical protein